MFSVTFLERTARYLLDSTPVRMVLDSSLFRLCRLDAWLSWLIAFFTGALAAFSEYRFQLVQLVLPTLAFCLMTASIFVLNQCFDIENDRANKHKSGLPIARGQISFRRGLVLAFFLVITSLGLSIFAGRIFQALMAAFLLLWFAYSHPKLHLKSRPVTDLIVAGVGAGFIPFFIAWSAFAPSTPFPSMLGPALLLAQAGGHSVHIVTDREADCKVGLKTSAVRFGAKGVAGAGLVLFLSSLGLFVASVLHGEVPLVIVAIPVAILPVAYATISKYVAAICGDAQESVFAGMRRSLIYLQVCMLAAFGVAFAAVLAWR